MDAKEIEAKAAIRWLRYLPRSIQTWPEIRKGLSMREGETQCQAVEREQREYVKPAQS